MPTFQDLERAFVKAHEAGDKQAASALASEMRLQMSSAEVKKPEEKKVEKPVEPSEPSEDSSDLLRGFTNYLPQLKETYGGTKVLAGKVFGSEDLMKSGLETMAAAKAELASKHKATDSFTSALDKGVGAVLTDWLPYQIGSGTANLVESLGVMLAGAAVGSAVAPGLGTIGGGATALVEKELAKRGIKELAEKIVKESGEEAAKELFERETKAVVKDLAKKYAATTALAVQAGFHGTGETTSRAVEEAQRLGKEATDIELERVLPSAIVHGVAEFFGDKIGLGAWKNISDDAKTGMLNLAGSLLKNMAVTGTKEAPVEVIQSAAERFGAKLSLTDATAVKEYIDSAAAAYGMSVAPAAGGTVRGYAAAMEKKDAEIAQASMQQQVSSQKASEEAAKIGQTAVVDPQGNVAPVSFTPIQPASVGAATTATPPAATAAPVITPPTAVTPPAAPAALAAPAAPAAPTGVVENKAIEAAYAANNVNTEKVRKALEPQLKAMGLDTKEKQKEFLNAKRDELNIPAYNNKDPAGSKKAKQQFITAWEKSNAEQQTTGPVTPTSEPSVVSPTSTVEDTTGGVATPVVPRVEPTGRAAEPTAVAETTQRAPLDPEVLRAAYTEQIKIAAESGLDFPSYDELSEEERAALEEEIQLTRGMTPSKGGQKVGFLSPAMASIIKSRVDKKIASGEIDLTKAPQPVIDLYEEERKDWGDRNEVRTTAWNDLSTDEKAIYLDNIKRNTIEERSNAFDILADYRDAKLEGIAPRGASFYETNRAAYNKELPAWVDLTAGEREAFLKAIEPGLGAKTAKPKVDTEQMDEGFKAVVEKINKRLETKATKETEKKSKAQEVSKDEARAAKEEVEVGKELPTLVKMMLGEGGVNSVLTYISRKAGGVMIGKKDSPRSEAIRNYEKRYGALSRAIFKNVAASLSRINFSKSQVVVDANNAVIKQLVREGKLAAYDPKSDTFYFTKDGMDEMTVLHEIVHAGTIKILYAYKNNPSSLTREQREAAEQINKVYEFAQKKLSEKYPNQMENVYEFVSYALTEPRFQEELSRIQAPSLAKYTLPPKGSTSGFNMQSLWTHLTKAMMKLYGLTKAAARFFELRSEVYDDVASAFTTTKYKLQALDINKNTLQVVKAAAENLTSDGKIKLTPGEQVTLESVRDARDASYEDLAEKYPKAYKDLTDAGLVDFVKEHINNKEFASDILARADVTYGQSKVGLTKQAGFQGNALIEVTQAFQGILATPEAGIDIEALPARAPKQAKPPIQAPANGSTSFEEMRNALPSYNTNPASEFAKMSKGKAGEGAVRLFQNDRAAIKNWQSRLRYTGRLIAYSAGFNNIYDQITLSSGNAHYLYTQYVQNSNDAVRAGTAEYAKKRGLNIDQAVNELGLFAIARHEEERRRTLYLREVPLEKSMATLNDAKGNPITADAARNAILSYLDTHKLDESGAKYLRDQLDKIVNDKKNLSKEKEDVALLNEDNQKYSVAGFTPEQIQAAKTEYERHKADANPVLNQLKEINKAVIELNEQANYMSAFAKNYIMFYGYENYVPFKGKHFNEDKADIFNLDSRKLGGELQDRVHTFEGRVTVPDNPILQVMSDGAQAALRAGRRYVTESIYNAVKDKTLQGSLIKYNGKEYISFQDRANEDLLKELKGETKIFHYMPDGKVAIIQIDDKSQREAIRRTYRETNPLVDTAINMGNKVTGFLGQMHTRYNIAFAPVNFVRDVLTNAFTLGAELGPKETFRYIGSVATGIATGGMKKTLNFARLYSQGKTSTIDSLAEKDDYYRDLRDYVKTGGKVSYIAGIAPKGQYQEFFKGVGGSRILNTKDKVDGYFDMWIDTFELAARVSSFRVTKANEIAKLTKEDPSKSKKEIERAAITTASAYAKNLANFEQVGQLGRALGAFFMFFRPSATGAVRAIDAIAPAFNMNIEKAKISLPEYARAANIREELSKTVTPAMEKKLKAELAEMEKAIKIFEENYTKAKTNARVMMMALTGIGAFAYAMSLMTADDDDLGRNRTGVDDMSRWTRFARFPIPGTDIMIQIPWGFGLGGFAAAGAQTASMFNGNVRVGDTLANLMVIGMDSFLPLPVSRISPIEKPLEFTVDSLLPSAVRPLVEYAMNVDALGRQIYNNRQSRFGDAYTGGDNVPEIYKDAAIWWLKTTGNDVSPNSLYFFANNYADGASRLAHNANNVRLWLGGEKEFNPKTDTMLLDSFFGTKSNFDAREWQRVEDDLKERSKYVKMLKDNHPADYAAYMNKHPMDQMLVKMYNHDANGRLKNLREQANKWRTMEGIDPIARTKLVKNIILQENIEKRRLIDLYKAYGVEP